VQLRVQLGATCKSSFFYQMRVGNLGDPGGARVSESGVGCKGFDCFARLHPS
jgi:hypothetical protein